MKLKSELNENALIQGFPFGGARWKCWGARMYLNFILNDLAEAKEELVEFFWDAELKKKS